MKAQNFTKFTSAALIATLLSTAMLLSAPVAHADDHAKCQHKIEKAEAKLDDAIRKHGERSSQAESRRRDLKR